MDPANGKREQIISFVLLTFMIGRLLRNFFFLRLEVGVMGSHTVDCSNNFYTAKLQTLFSCFWNLVTTGVDFFAQNLESENCFVVPSVPLVTRSIHYVSLQKARASIVIPLWPSSSSWPLLTSKYKQFMKSCFLQNGTEAVTLGRNLNSFLGSVHCTGNFVALRLEFL